MSAESFYNEPRYYDIAFGWDKKAEVDFLEAVLRSRAEGEVKSVLELGSGTGQWLLALAKRGYAAAGVDISRDMLDYARTQLVAAGVQAELFLKDMAEFALFRRFDAAICMLGTFGYLSAGQAEGHFRHIAQHLRPGGVYIIDLGLVPLGSAPEFPPQEWSARRDGIGVEARWELVGPWDPATRTTTERLTLTGTERGWQRAWEQESPLRVYSLGELRALAEADGYFRFAIAYRGFDCEAEVDAATAEKTQARLLSVFIRTDKPTPRPEGADLPPETGGGRDGRRPRGLRGGRDRDRNRDRDHDRGRGRRGRPERWGRDGGQAQARGEGGGTEIARPPRDLRPAAPETGSTVGPGIAGPGGDLPAAAAGAEAGKRRRRRRRRPKKDTGPQADGS